LAKTHKAKCQNHHQRVCKQTIGKIKFSSYLLQHKSCSSKHRRKHHYHKWYASQPKERAIFQLVGANTNELKEVTHVTSQGQYSNMVAHKTKEREIVPHVCYNT
jgi:hypothetical protein